MHLTDSITINPPIPHLIIRQLLNTYLKKPDAIPIGIYPVSLGDATGALLWGVGIK